MKIKMILLALIFILPSVGMSREVFKIEIGSNYERYSKKELRRRVWELERAVAQLQDQVFHLSMSQNQYQPEEWTCHMQSFGKTHMASARTRGKALALVMSKCSSASNAIHCDSGDVSCDNS